MLMDNNKNSNGREKKMKRRRRWKSKNQSWVYSSRLPCWAGQNKNKNKYNRDITTTTRTTVLYNHYYYHNNSNDINNNNKSFEKKRIRFMWMIRESLIRGHAGVPDPPPFWYMGWSNSSRDWCSSRGPDSLGGWSPCQDWLLGCRGLL